MLQNAYFMLKTAFWGVISLLNRYLKLNHCLINKKMQQTDLIPAQIDTNRS